MLRRLRLSKPELLTLAILLSFGSAFALTIPIGAGWDEETHVIRAWEIASLEFIPNEVPRNELPFPTIYWNLSYRRSSLIRPVEPGFWAKYGALPLDGLDYIYSELKTRSVYSPPLLFPHALAIRYLGHKFMLPALPVYYAARLFGLLGYVGLAWLAVRLVPFGKWVLALVAIAPTAVFQAATITADPISNGLGLLFVAGTLALSVKRDLGWKEWFVQLGLAALLFLAKPNLAFLAILPFLVIRPRQFMIRRGYLILLLATISLAVVEVGGWALIAFPRAGPGTGEGEPLAQLSYLITQPLAIARTMLADLVEKGILYFQQLIARFGYDYWLVPLPVYVLYVASIAAALFAGAGERTPTRRVRVGLLVAFVAGIVGTLLTVYIAANAVAVDRITHVQGRYFAAMIPLLLLAAVRRPATQSTAVPARLAVALACTSVAVYGAGLLLVYHVPCGTAFFRPGLCYQPVYKNWAPDARYSPPATELTQEIVPECGGMRELRVWVDAGAAARDGETEFVLRDSAADYELVRQSVTNGQLPGGGWYSMRFAPEWDSQGKSYVLNIQGAGESGAEGARVAYTLRPEYDHGRLYEAGLAMDVDLVFQYGCVAGLARLNP